MKNLVICAGLNGATIADLIVTHCSKGMTTRRRVIYTTNAIESVNSVIRKATYPDFIIMSHASNVIGLISPVEDVFALSKEYGAVTVVDMAQTTGLVELNVGLQTVDFAVFAGHKTLLGSTEISGFVMKPGFDLSTVLFGDT